MIRYQYVTDFAPPAPFVQVTVQSPGVDGASRVVPAQIDSAADRSVIPGNLIDDLGLAGVREILIEGLGGQVHRMQTFVVLLQIRDFPPVAVEVVAHASERFVLLGRDVLNQFRVVLDGPKKVLEIGQS